MFTRICTFFELSMLVIGSEENSALFPQMTENVVFYYSAQKFPVVICKVSVSYVPRLMKLVTLNEGYIRVFNSYCVLDLAREYERTAIHWC